MIKDSKEYQYFSKLPRYKLDTTENKKPLIQFIRRAIKEYKDEESLYLLLNITPIGTKERRAIIRMQNELIGDYGERFEARFGREFVEPKTNKLGITIELIERAGLEFYAVVEATYNTNDLVHHNRVQAIMDRLNRDQLKEVS